MLIVAGSVRLPPDMLDRARPAMERVLTANRAEKGCLSFSYAEDVLDRGLIHVFELWRSRADLDRHGMSSHVAEWRATWADLKIGDRDLQVYETSGPQPV